MALTNIREALGLRHWALNVLTSTARQPPTCSQASWQLFLGGERCAIPLKTELLAQGHFELLDPVGQRELSDAARRETQRVLSARAQLHLIDNLAVQGEWKIIVLKGAVVLQKDRSGLDLADVDILATHSDAPRLATALDRAGFSGIGFGSDQHLKGRIAEGELTIEIHTVVDASDPSWSQTVWDRLVPLQGTSGLRRLSARDHLWHLLTHVVVHHPHRQGAIRDLLLIRDAVADCSQDELVDLTKDIASHPYTTTLEDVLESARELGGTVPFVDRFISQSATVYYLGWQGNRLPLPWVIRAEASMWACMLLLGRAAFRRFWDWVLMEDVDQSLFPLIAWLEQRTSRFGRAARVASRLIRGGIAAMLAVPLALVASVVVRRVTKSNY